jgi:deazaflavin-dependent oxidoreductase (nitroreductase family)
MRNHQPSRTLKFLFDLPSSVFKWRLGWALGKRVLAVTHTGRKSGKTYTTILEVALFDEETKESVVASAYGTEADWYRNIRATPASRVQTGRLDYVPEQRFLNDAEAREAAVRFCREHPWEAKLVPRVLPSIGAAIPTDAQATPEELLGSLPMVAFRPKG